MTSVHVIVPDGIDDPARPSGGNAYDRHVCDELRAIGWDVHEHALAGSWPRADPASLAALAAVLEPLADGTTVLLDGLIASVSPEVLVPASRRLRLVVLVHMPFGDIMADDAPDDAEQREHAVLAAAAAVVATSAFTRRRLLALYGLEPDRVHVAAPGVAAAGLAAAAPAPGSLLCVASVIPRKGHDVLIAALATLGDLTWRCVCAGSLDRNPAFVGRLRQRARATGIGERVAFVGPRTGDALERCYAAAGLLILPSRGEAYGMVVTEALARGVPVVASEVGGLPEALGHVAGGARPGLLVPPGDPVALAGALRSWLSDAELRRGLQEAAQERRASLEGWSSTTSVLAGVLAGAAE